MGQVESSPSSMIDVATEGLVGGGGVNATGANGGHASPHHRRVDPRWARVGLDQLRDEAFLSRHLRRMETIAGAREASGGRRPRARRSLFVPAPVPRNGRRRTQPPATVPGDDAASAMTTTMSGDGTATGADPKQALVTRVEERRREELVHGLVLLAEMAQPARVALLLSHLKEQLLRASAIADPFAELVGLRRAILREVHEAVLAQHHQQRHHAALGLAIAQLLDQGPTSVTPGDDGGTAPTETISGNTRGPGSTSSLSAPSMKPKDKAACEARLGLEVVLALVAGLMDASVVTTTPKKMLLEQLVFLADDLAPLSLAPPLAGTSGGAAAAAVTAMTASQSAAARELLAKIERFLIDIAAARDHGAPRHVGPTESFHITDRTRALECLIHFAVARGALRGFLVVLKIVFGCGEFAVAGATEPEGGALTSAREKISPTSSSKRPMRSSNELQDAQEAAEMDELLAAGDPRGDGVSILAVEQKLKQVHKQRLDLVSRGEIDAQLTVDQLLHQNRRKPSTKPQNTARSMASKDYGAHNLTVFTMASNPHRPSVSGITMPGKLSKSKDELFLNNGTLATGSSTSAPAFDFHSPGHSPRSDKPTSRDTAVPVVACPRYDPLHVGRILQALHGMQPAAPSRSSGRSHRSVLTADRSTAKRGESPNQGMLAADDDEVDDQEVWSCGQNSYGELGHGDTTTRKTFERIEALQRKQIIQVSAGNEHSLALGADGNVWTCGYNDNGQCGHGVTTRISHPTELAKLGGDTTIAQIHAYNGCEHTIFVTQDGRVASCGYNYRGQLGHGNTQSESVPKIMRSLDGHVVRLVSCSYYHTIIACTGPNGQNAVYTFGRNDYGQLGHNDTIDRKIPQAIEGFHDEPAISVACGQYHTMVVLESGKLFAFGKNDYGQLGVDAIENQLAPTQVRQSLEQQACLEVRCGYYHSIVLCVGAHLYGFGRNDYGQLGLGRSSNTAAANLQLQQQRFPFPQLIEDLEGREITRFACGCYHSIAVSDNGVLYVFGRNNHGQLGTGDTSERLYPFPIDDFVGKRIAMVAAGFYHTLVLTGGKDDDVGSETNVSVNNARESGVDRPELVIECGGGTHAHEITSSGLLSHQVVREVYQSTDRQRGASESTNNHNMTKSNDDDNENSGFDPSCDPDTDDNRNEDKVYGSTSGGLNDCEPTSLMKTGRFGASNSDAHAADSINIAIIILAQLDRMVKPFLPHNGSFPYMQPPSFGFTQNFVSSTSPSPYESFECCLEPFVVDVQSATFSSLGDLISHLSSQRIQQLESSSLVESPDKQLLPKCRLQDYAISVCLRLVQANVAQLIRSGVGYLLCSKKVRCFDESSGVSLKQSSAVGELSFLRQSLDNLKEIVLRIIDVRSRESASPATSRVIAECVMVLMVGFELFFSCPSAQVNLFFQLVESGEPGHGNTLHLPTDQTIPCSSCSRKSCHVINLSRKTRQLLLEPFLSRLTEDSIVAKLLPVSMPLGTLPSSDSPASDGPLRLLQSTASILFEQLYDQFVITMADISVRSERTPKKGSGNAILGFLSSLQKHLSAFAHGCSKWSRSISPNTQRSSSQATNVSILLQDTGRKVLILEPATCDDFPMPWRLFSEFTLLVLNQAMEVLSHTLARTQIPSPIHGRYQSQTYDDQGDGDTLSSSVVRIVECSVVGQLLPSLVTCLHTFARIPSFAVALVGDLKSLLELLDEFNQRIPASTSSNEEAMGKLGKTITPGRPSAQSDVLEKKLNGKQENASSRKDKVTSQKLSLSETMTSSWSYALEKELAMVLTHLCATVCRGDSLFETEFDCDEEVLCSAHSSHLLFSGGIRAEWLHWIASGDERNNVRQRTIPHAPVDFNSEPRHSNYLHKTFTVELPPFPSSRIAAGPETILQNPDAFGGLCRIAVDKDLSCFFLETMANISTTQDAFLRQSAYALCNSVRNAYTAKDTSYRMLIRQTVKSIPPSEVDSSPEVLLENATFAGLLHHNALTLSAWSIVSLRFARKANTVSTMPTPPPSFIRHWRTVADVRRRFVARRTALRNEATSEIEAQRKIAELFQEMLDRAQFLLLVNQDEEVEHSEQEFDSGFVSPTNPAYTFRAASSKLVKGSTYIQCHMNSLYENEHQEQVPFLLAHPSSKWRRVRMLLHCIVRWKFAVKGSSQDYLVASAAMDFIVNGHSNIICLLLKLLVDPCRRLAIVTKGFHLMAELARIPSFDGIRQSVFYEALTGLAADPQTAMMGALTGKAKTAGEFYRELLRQAQHEYWIAVSDTIAERCRDNILTSPEDLLNAQSSNRMWIFLCFFRIWVLHFSEDHFEFVNDHRILQLAQQLLKSIQEGMIASSKSSLTSSQNESIRSINLNSTASNGLVTAGAIPKPTEQLHIVLDLLMRYIPAHFAVQQVTITGERTIPRFAASPDIFDSLFDLVASTTVGARQAQPDRLITGAVPSGVRRSYEIIVAPRHFSPLKKGLCFAYQDMLSPGPESERAAMSPLLKANEFSITTWMFISSSTRSNSDDQQLVFMRGGECEISPYLLLCSSDLEASLHIEIGIVLRPKGTVSPNRLVWERLVSKDPVALGRWTHIALVLEGSKLRLYINGLLDGQRSIPSSHVATMAASGNVELGFHFGRLPGKITPATGDGSSELLSSLFQTQSANYSTLRSFDGLLSHFRFHNRALSPIHVRIVYDEKKPVRDELDVVDLSVDAAPPASDDVQNVVKVLSVVRVLSESSEGLVHLSQPKWIGLLWNTFTNATHFSIQRPCLRVLTKLLPDITPHVVNQVIALEPSPIWGSCTLPHHLFRLIGLRLCQNELVALPPAASSTGFELRNSTAARIVNDHQSRRDSTATANEIVQCLSGLARGIHPQWKTTIYRAMIETISAPPREGDDSTRWWQYNGVMYALSGTQDVVRGGATVSIPATKEHATVIATHEFESPQPEGVNDADVLTQRQNCTTLFAALHPVSDDAGVDPLNFRSWYERVADSISNITAKGDEAPISPFYVRLGPDEVQPQSWVLMDHIAEHDEHARMALEAVLKNVPGIDAIDAAPPGRSARRTLDQWLGATMSMKALARLALVPSSSAFLVRYPEFIARILRTATRDDGNARFETLPEIERRLWIVRSHVYQVLTDLGDDGEAELEMWIKARLPRQPSECVIDAGRYCSVKEDKASERDQLQTMGESCATPCEGEFDGRLVLQPENLADGEEDIVQDSIGLLSDEKLGGIESTKEFELDDVEDSAGVNDGSDLEEDEEDEDEGENDDDEDDEDDADDDEDEDDMEANRQEFVDELMLMGFPEEWCVLALKQTENDIVGASAWIVDNLEYLSRLQTSLDKQRDQSMAHLPINDEDDDNDQVEEKARDVPSPHQHAQGAIVNPEDTTFVNPSSGLHSPKRGDGLVNDKEMGRKIFGETYFPFEEGGFGTNFRHRFFRGWRDAERKQFSSTTIDDSEVLPCDESKDNLSKFDEMVDSLELTGLLDQLKQLEYSFFVLNCRNLLLNTFRGANDVDVGAVQLLMVFSKLVLFRGDQMFSSACSDDSYDGAARNEAVIFDLVKILVKKPAVAVEILDFALCELEKAASDTRYEAVLWTQRDLRRHDRAVLEEPAVELASWLLELVLRREPSGVSLDVMKQALDRLRQCLRASNLPVKFVVLKSISCIVRHFRTFAKGDKHYELDFAGLLHAGRARYSRELVQHRGLFSIYLQAYIEALHSLRRLCDTIELVTPPPVSISIASATTSVEPQSNAVDEHLTFDRKKCRSSLLQISEDGDAVSYTGNELWKMVVTTTSFMTGVHSWTVRIDKSASSYLFIGVATGRANLDSFLGSDEHSWGFIGDKAIYYQRNRLRVYGDTFGEGDCIGVQLDCELGTLSFSKNGVPLGVAFDNLAGELFPAVAFYSRHQKVTILPSGEQQRGASQGVPVDLDLLHGSVEEAVLVCDVMEHLAGSRNVLPPQSVRSAYLMTSQWLEGTHRHVTTRAGRPLWVDVTPAVCDVLGFRAQDKVRTPRGNGIVVGVADGRLWVEVENELGAWFVHPSKLRRLGTPSIPQSSRNPRAVDAESVERALPELVPIAESDNGPVSSPSVESTFAISEANFDDLINCSAWSLALDRMVLGAVNDHCDSTSTSPWNVTPAQVIEIVASKGCDIQGHLPGDKRHDVDWTRQLLVARFGLLRFFNAYLNRVIGFFDMTWYYFEPQSSLQPCRLLAACRGSIFTTIKNEFFTSLMDKTLISPKKADDDYDYPEDLCHLLINRPKAATAKCHPGTTKSLMLSMFGQAFEELHFLPLRTLRMVYSHPMDDGQLRSFKVKFEGEGVDDYGGPYREFFSQFFAELQMIINPDSSSDSTSGNAAGKGIAGTSSESTVGESFLPFFMPSPNWRNGVGSNREKFVLNAAILGHKYVGTARILNVSNAKRKAPAQPLDNPEVTRQLHSEMCHFLGQMIGICVRTRVCVRLDLAISVWKQLVGEDQEWEHDPDGFDRALSSLKEIDYVSFTLLKSLQALYEDYSQRDDQNNFENKRRRLEIEEEMAAMDLTFTTYLSDGRFVELKDGGFEIAVTPENVHEYIRLALAARMNESKAMINIIKQGIHSVMPISALALFTWEELERRVCGVAEVDVELLKQNTEYDEDLSSNDEFIQRFWRVLAAMEDEDKRAFLRFVWARSRLPVGTSQFHQKFKIQSLASGSLEGSNGSASAAPSTANSDLQLPKSHTCFFALQLPRYSSDEVCQKQLLYAIRNCVEMDGDFRLADTEMTGWTDIDPTDRLRF